VAEKPLARHGDRRTIRKKASDDLDRHNLREIVMKSNYSFDANVEVDHQTGKVLAVYLKFRDGKSHRTEEHVEGDVLADYDRNGRLLGIEVLAPCPTSVLTQIVKQARVKKFVESSMPSSMLVPA
jgi:uncharacterized protein YuzE